MLTINISKRVLAAFVGIVMLATLTVACSDNSSGDDATGQVKGQQTVNQYQRKSQASVKYPLEEMNTFLELEQQREKLLRFNDPEKIGYVYIFNPGVKEPVGYFTVRGKVSSTNSQMTPSDQVYWTCKHNHGCQPVVVNSPSDDGSYGENEPGYFFYTTEDVYVFVPSIMAPLFLDAPIKLYVDLPQLNDTSMEPTSVGETPEQREKNRKAGEERAKNLPAEDTSEEDGGN